MSNRRIEIFDSTLRDGAQGEDISFSLEDKIKVAVALDDMGVSYIEAGNPGSNPKDMEFFKRMKEVDLKNSKLAAFGATRKANIKVEDDINIKSLIKAETDVIVIFGKAWDFQVKEILKTSLQENINMINDSIKYIKSKSKEVIFDAEHFFDGYKENKAYAMETINTAKEAGADVIVLCDTNGGTLPSEIRDISKDVMKSIGGRVGIHCHNDIGMAISNSIIAVEEGICHVQGTFIGVGERCGNANLSAIIPTLQFKMGFEVIPQERLANLTKTSRFISEILNINLSDNIPYIGASAFAHKGGMHIDAVCKSSKSYEHIKPELIGNDRRFLVSEVSGKSTILKEIQKIFPNITRESEEVEKITNRLKELEYEGYKFEGAEGTVELLIRKTIGKYKPFFKLNHFKTIGEQPWNNKYFTSTALINITVDGKNKMTASEGDGPVNALDKALREALESFYPQLKEVRLVDYKVRVLDSESATGAKVRVLIESTDGIENWSTVGVSRDVVQASWIALVDSLEYKLIKDIEKTVRMYF
ncbi:citramalate synthase [Clostridium tertium]|uniref:Citramalate synthase n=1 Tax=Clostridium tertium TaxID=1559 RepID=A0A9X3XHM7_9CLOT|nr:citramalate synthase [Clostridium tertium]MDC4239550.1 citramalate synthase [Clostridium tertium]